MSGGEAESRGCSAFFSCVFVFQLQFGAHRFFPGLACGSVRGVCECVQSRGFCFSEQKELIGVEISGLEEWAQLSWHQ